VTAYMIALDVPDGEGLRVIHDLTDHQQEMIATFLDGHRGPVEVTLFRQSGAMQASPSAYRVSPVSEAMIAVDSRGHCANCPPCVGSHDTHCPHHRLEVRDADASRPPD
jgi:hypothetical protein